MDVAVLIVNSIASLAAVVGLIITCCQFRKTMTAQKRAINVSLFDLRMEILTSIENGKFAFNRTRARMLFNDSIADSIEKYDEAKREEKRYVGLKNEYLDVVRSRRADDTYEEATDLLRQIEDYSSMDHDNPTYEQIRASLRKCGITGKWMHGANHFEAETVNYIDASEAASNWHSEAEERKKKLTKTVKQFIETSIQ